jgi:hypothetical protein
MDIDHVVDAIMRASPHHIRQYALLAILPVGHVPYFSNRIVSIAAMHHDGEALLIAPTQASCDDMTCDI